MLTSCGLTMETATSYHPPQHFPEARHCPGCCDDGRGAGGWPYPQESHRRGEQGPSEHVEQPMSLCLD